MTTSKLWFAYKSELKKQFWKEQVFWSAGYFACSIGDASTETIAKYIKEQGWQLAYIHWTKDPVVLRSTDKIDIIKEVRYTNNDLT